MRSPLFAFSLTLSLAALLTTRGAAGDLTPASVWKTDFAGAEAEAKEQGRPLVVHFHAKWCVPCKQMEREVLDTAAVLKALDAGFVAVKVDYDRNANIRSRFKIDKVPTDLIVSPEGKVLHRSEGYVTGSKYTAKLGQIDGQFAKDGKRLARSQPAAVNSNTETSKSAASAIPAEKSASSASPAVAATGDKLVPPPTEPKKIVEAAISSAPVVSAKTEVNPEVPALPAAGSPANSILLAMDGYCPVTLRMTRTWKAGSSDITLEHDGQTFYFTAPDKRDAFKANPKKFAPRLMGCDPVALARNDVAVRGSVKFGAFYEGELFLFETAENRTAFRKDPGRYAKLQHALKPEDIQKIATVAGQ
jgi:thiol-disulfide isomerase/thioredoxin/YHS domain-containing protein